MTARQTADWQAYQALAAFFDEEADIVNAHDILKEDIATFRNLMSTLKTKMDETTPSVTGADRMELKKSLAETIRSLLLKLKAHAAKYNITDLEQFCKPSESAIAQMPETEFVAFINEVVEKVEQYHEALAKYSVSAQQRADFAQKVARYAAYMPQIKVSQSKSSVAIESVNDLFKRTKAFVNDILTIAVTSIEHIELEFVKAYQDIREGRTPSVSYTQVTVKVGDAETKMPLQKATVQVPVLKMEGTTDAHGKWTVRTGSKREITLIIHKTDWKSQEITVEKIIKGRTREVEVWLERVVVVV